MTTGHDQQVDMWALGILIYEMCTGNTPFVKKDGKTVDMVDLFGRIAGVKVRSTFLFILLCFISIHVCRQSEFICTLR